MTSRPLQGTVMEDESNSVASKAIKTEEELSAINVLAGLQMAGAVQQPVVSEREEPQSDEEAEAAMIDMLFGAGATSSAPHDRELERHHPGERSRSRSPAGAEQDATRHVAAQPRTYHPLANESLVTQPDLARNRKCVTNRWLLQMSSISPSWNPELQLKLEPETGVHTFVAPERACATLCQYLTSHTNRSPEGFLVIANQTYPGYSKYDFIETRRNQRNQTIQEQFSAHIPCHFIPEQSCIETVAHAIPEIADLLVSIFQQIGLSYPRDLSRLKHTHGLVQADPHAVFAWHDDASDMFMSRRMISVIVSLNDISSGIEVLGQKKHFWYRQRGHTAVFYGHAIHRTVVPLAFLKCMRGSRKGILQLSPEELAHAPVKLAFFFD